MGKQLFIYWREGSGPASMWASTLAEAEERIRLAEEGRVQQFGWACRNPLRPGSLRPATEQERDNLYAHMAAQFGG